MKDAFKYTRSVAGLALFAILPGAAIADTFYLRRDMIVPVEFETSLTVRDNAPGDRFYVRVRDTDLLPKGSELEGTIDRIHPARGNRSASMDLRFNHVILPDHTRVYIDASPMPLDKRFFTRDGDGRMIAKQDIRTQQADVVGGAVGGFIVGSIFHRRIAGTILGTIIGSVAAQNERENDANLVVKKGDKVGALLNETVTITPGVSVEGPPPPPPPTRYDYNRRLDRGMDGPSRNRGVVAGPVERENHYNIRITYHDKLMEFPPDALPYRVGKDLIVPLEPAARQLELDVDRRSNGTVYVDGPDFNLRLTVGSRDARFDGENIQLHRPLLDKNGVLFVPIEALLRLVKDDVFLNGNKIVITD